MKLPNLGAALDRAIARHVEAALSTTPTPPKDRAADSRATEPKGSKR